MALEDAHHGRSASKFVLQWHLTNACEMHCKHCYDRSNPLAPRLPEALAVLDQLESFCERRGVTGHVCFSGGNPFLYPWFFELYRSAAERGFELSILGNPVAREALETLLAIRRPTYYQVSLEGLEEHNDEIRGAGSYRRAIDFLSLLAELGVRPVVMTTLTRANVDQLVPLSRVLRGKVHRHAWNRLSQVGEGARLEQIDQERFGWILVEWMVEAAKNPALGMKDNLFNILRHELELPLLGGCTGFGCGAAFNFVALLPTFEVHACRKFPSPLGNLREAGLLEIYGSERADGYRRGCTACDGCAIRHRCGGCLAVAHGAGLDPLRDRDPHCFM